MHSAPITTRYRAYGPETLDRLPESVLLTPETRRALEIVSRVLPFRINEHVTCALIDWRKAPDDPIFRLPHSGHSVLSGLLDFPLPVNLGSLKSPVADLAHCV